MSDDVGGWRASCLVVPVMLPMMRLTTWFFVFTLAAAGGCSSASDDIISSAEGLTSAPASAEGAPCGVKQEPGGPRPVRCLAGEACFDAASNSCRAQSSLGPRCGKRFNFADGQQYDVFCMADETCVNDAQNLCR